MTDSPDPTYAERLTSSSPLAGAALAFGDLVEDVDQRRAAIRVHRFDSTEDAKAAAGRDELSDGDVIVVESERVTGFMVVVLPAAVTEERGALYRLSSPAHDYAGGSYIDSAVVAEREGRALGFLLHDETPQERIRSMHKLMNDSGARVRTNPDPTNPEWKAALDRLTIAHNYLKEHDAAYAEVVNDLVLRTTEWWVTGDRATRPGYSRA
ncbi:hypothetical protein [Streptomyces sp. A5-4]|uniref:hypothetical protein n=1 Tax=Streptomyces sp. A5-4 TaxID=3384771 RepID=UPI003DA7C523